MTTGNTKARYVTQFSVLHTKVTHNSELCNWKLHPTTESFQKKKAFNSLCAKVAIYDDNFGVYWVEVTSKFKSNFFRVPPCYMILYTPLKINERGPTFSFSA